MAEFAESTQLVGLPSCFARPGLRALHDDSPGGALVRWPEFNDVVVVVTESVVVGGSPSVGDAHSVTAYFDWNAGGAFEIVRAPGNHYVACRDDQVRFHYV